MIALHNINFSYGDKKIFTNLNIAFCDHGTTYISGGSGSGKTTLLKLIMGLAKPDSGIIEGTESIRFSVAFQEDRLLPFTNVLSNLMLVASNKGDVQKAKGLLNRLGLLDSENAYPASLSGGMKRRVSIARALLNNYDVLVLDEPFTGLDEKSKKLAVKCILEEVGDRPIIMVSHNKDDAILMNAKTVVLP